MGNEQADVTESEIYRTLTSLVMHSEQVRWMRLNVFLIQSSIFVAAWVTLFAKTDPFAARPFLLALLCLPGIVIGFVWAFLGKRSSGYLDDFHKLAEDIERRLPAEVARPFCRSEERRSSVRSGFGRITSSKFLVTYVPIMFSLFFLALFVLSFILGCDCTPRIQPTQLPPP
jgi:hypothetical protein